MFKCTNIPVFSCSCLSQAMATSLMQAHLLSGSSGQPVCCTQPLAQPAPAPLVHSLSVDPSNKCISTVSGAGRRFRLPVANNLQCNRKQLNLHKTHDHRQLDVGVSAIACTTSLIGSASCPPPFHVLLLRAHCGTHKGQPAAGRTATAARQGFAIGSLMAS